MTGDRPLVYLSLVKSLIDFPLSCDASCKVCRNAAYCLFARERRKSVVGTGLVSTRMDRMIFGTSFVFYISPLQNSYYLIKPH